ncbi:MAG: hypothetical protein M0Z59_08990 [Nitrospiraceae bacterium]|nr:hypothetical protein [Nitrospiraceae bacterium]
MRKTVLFLVLVIISMGVAAWPATPHKDYATLKIKDCNACHQSNGVAPTHGSMWVKEHRLYAEKKPNNCADCHQLSFCSDCHYGGGLNPDLSVSNFGVDYMPRSHTTDFMEIHPIKALDDPRSCYRCHDAQKFCAECHNKFNPADLRFVSHRKGWSDLEVSAGGPKHSSFSSSQCQTCHPNSVLPTHSWTDAHASEARRNLATCQGCHPDGDVCMKCHSAQTGLKINPHPRGWDNVSGRLRSSGNNRTCIKCH